MPVAGRAPGSVVVKVLVSVGHHVFTRTMEKSDPDDQILVESNDPRCFCPVRYGWSTDLPMVISRNAAKNAYFSEKGNFIFVDSLPTADPYVVAFNLQRGAKPGLGAIMNVVSAYEKASLPKVSALDKILFSTLVFKVAAGQPVTRPKK